MQIATNLRKIRTLCPQIVYKLLICFLYVVSNDHPAVVLSTMNVSSFEIIALLLIF
jgi:hypothetical protein